MTVNPPSNRFPKTRRLISNVVRGAQNQVRACFRSEPSGGRDTFARTGSHNTQEISHQGDTLTGLQAKLTLYNMALTEENSATQQRITELLKRLRRQKQHKKALEEAINTNNKLLTEIEKTSQQNNHIEAQRLQRQVDNATEKQAPLIPPEVVYETTNALSGLNEVLASLNSLFGA